MNYSDEKEVVQKSFLNALSFHFEWPGFCFFLWSEVEKSLVVWEKFVSKPTSQLAVSAQERPQTWAASWIESIFAGEHNSNFVHSKLHKGGKKKAFDCGVIKALHFFNPPV